MAPNKNGVIVGVVQVPHCVVPKVFDPPWAYAFVAKLGAALPSKLVAELL